MLSNSQRSNLGILSRDTAALLGLGILLEISLLIMWGVTKLNRTSALLETYFAIPFAIYLVTVVWIMRSKRGNFYSSVIIIVLISIVMYATFLLQQAPTLSGDLYRYIWDGKLINNGISPYRYPPDASQLAYLRDSNWLLVEKNNIVSPYPPLLELLNALTYRLSPTVLAFKTLTVVFALGSIIALPFFLRKLQFDPRLSAVFAWNPLFVLEFGSSAHDDSIAVFLVLVSFYLLTSNRKIPSAAVMALAVVSKLFPLLIVPLFLKRWGIRATALLVAHRGLFLCSIYPARWKRPCTNFSVCFYEHAALQCGSVCADTECVLKSGGVRCCPRCKSG